MRATHVFCCALAMACATAAPTGSADAQTPRRTEPRAVTSAAPRLPPRALTVSELRDHIDSAEWGVLASRGRALGTRLLEHIESSSPAPPNPIPTHLRNQVVAFQGDVARLSGRQPLEVREVVHGLVMETIQARKSGLRHVFLDVASARSAVRVALGELQRARQHRRTCAFREPVISEGAQHRGGGIWHVEISYREQTALRGQLDHEVERLQELQAEVDRLYESVRTAFRRLDYAANQMMRMLSAVVEEMREQRSDGATRSSGL